ELAAQASLRHRWVLRRRIGGLDADFVPALDLTLGSIQSSGRVGGLLRLGTVQSFPSLLLEPAVVARASQNEQGVTWSIAAGCEEAYFARNAFVEGNLFGDALAISARRFVWQCRLGGVVGLGGLMVDYSWVARGPEFFTKGLGSGQNAPHHFGAFALRRFGPTPLDGVAIWRWMTFDWMLEGSLGSGMSVERSEGLSDEYRAGGSARVSASKSVSHGFFVGWEMNGTLRDGRLLRPDDWYEDSLYLWRGLTVGKRYVLPYGDIVLRMGLGKGNVKSERVLPQEDQVTIARRHGGPSILWGIAYGYPLGRRTSLGFDVAFNSRIGEGSNTTSARFVHWGIGMKYYTGNLATGPR
ncbi:MAG: lipid A deacylase LpxR family protein, partial [Gemmatimonadetes bacterium]|nr:lipid A deacylase LpxR family protein [Gemmatimonadota bacterium]